MPELYYILDDMAARIFYVIAESGIFDEGTGIIHFENADEETFKDLIQKDRWVMVPFFVMICGYSVRELEKAGIPDIYRLREHEDTVWLKKFTNIVKECLQHPFHIETLIYKFYRNWEEHQKRHFRARSAESIIRKLRKQGIEASKIRVPQINREIDCAIPPDLTRMRVAIQIRTGVRRDLVKRAKEFSQECDDIRKVKPDVVYIPLYIILDDANEDEAKYTIEEELGGKEPYHVIVVSARDQGLRGAANKALKELLGILSSNGTQASSGS